MALDKAEAVPVDTHIWQVAKRYYGQELGMGARSVTERVHREIGEGWASSAKGAVNQSCSDRNSLAHPSSNAGFSKHTVNQQKGCGIVVWCLIWHARCPRQQAQRSPCQPACKQAGKQMSLSAPLPIQAANLLLSSVAAGAEVSSQQGFR